MHFVHFQLRDNFAERQQQLKQEQQAELSALRAEHENNLKNMRDQFKEKVCRSRYNNMSLKCGAMYCNSPLQSVYMA